ncbi:hypothetical protein [Catenovulum sediminis]|uniref:Uncharacterized protein n=1 Tax=Catenovulum sediminis TaxID=1740262 RepID=A0ABV1RII3_9ALTE
MIEPKKAPRFLDRAPALRFEAASQIDILIHPLIVISHQLKV